MRIGVIDVGSNTTRLLVASAGPDSLVPLETQKLRLSLGEEIERDGAVSTVHVAAAAKAVRGMAGGGPRRRGAPPDALLAAPRRPGPHPPPPRAAPPPGARGPAPG